MGGYGERRVILAQPGNTHPQLQVEFHLVLTVLRQKQRWLDPRMLMIALVPQVNLVPLEMIV